MAEKEYVVAANAIGVITGTDPRTGLDVVRYYSRGELVEIPEDQAERLLDLKAIVSASDQKVAADAAAKAEEDAAEARRMAAEAEAAAAEERAKAEAAAADAENAGATSETTSEEGEQLTRKQALQKEAEELGLDTSGTIAELEARIREKKAEA